MKDVVSSNTQSRELSRFHPKVKALAQYRSAIPPQLHSIDSARRRAKAYSHQRKHSKESTKKYLRGVRFPLRTTDVVHNLKESPRNFVVHWRYPDQSTRLERELPSLAASNAEIDRLTSGPEGRYAKLALARGSQTTSLLPRIYRSPGNGIALQTSTNKGTVNLIIEEGQAILVRASDDFAVQITCNLNPKSLSQLIDIYEGELKHLILP